INLGVGPDKAGRRLDEPVVGESEIVTGRGRDRNAVRTYRQGEQAKVRIVDVEVVVFLTNHHVGKEPAIGRDKIGPKERDFNARLQPAITAIVVRCGRAKKPGRGSEMY